MKGVDENTVRRWIKFHGLPAMRDASERGPGRPRLVVAVTDFDHWWNIRGRLMYPNKGVWFSPACFAEAAQ